MHCSKVGASRSVVAGLFLAWTALPAYGMTILQALTLAYQSSPQLLAERAQLREKDETLAQAWSHWRPTVQLSGVQNKSSVPVSGGTSEQDSIFSGLSPTADYDFVVSEALYRGGRTDAEVKQAIATIRAERASLMSIEQKVLVQAASDYCDLVRARDTLNLNLNNEKYLSQKLAAVRAQLSGGDASRTDVAQAEAAYESSIVQRINAEVSAEKSRLNVVRDTGGHDPGEVDYPEASLNSPGTVDEVTNAAMKDNPDVIAADYTEESAEAAVKDSWEQALPQISLVAGAQAVDGAQFKHAREYDLSVGVKVSIQLYSGGMLESQTRAKEQDVAMYRSNLDQQRLGAVNNAKAAWAQLGTYSTQIAALASQVAADQIALDGVQHQYDSGERTILDVFNANQALLHARVDLDQAKHDWVIAQYQLAQAMGHATAQIFKLPVTLYDPDLNLNNVKDRWFGFDIMQ